MQFNLDLKAFLPAYDARTLQQLLDVLVCNELPFHLFMTTENLKWLIFLYERFQVLPDVVGQFSRNGPTTLTFFVACVFHIQKL